MHSSARSMYNSRTRNSHAQICDATLLLGITIDRFQQHPIPHDIHDHPNLALRKTNPKKLQVQWHLLCHNRHTISKQMNHIIKRQILTAGLQSGNATRGDVFIPHQHIDSGTLKPRILRTHRVFKHNAEQLLTSHVCVYRFRESQYLHFVGWRQILLTPTRSVVVLR